MADPKEYAAKIKEAKTDYIDHLPLLRARIHSLSISVQDRELAGLDVINSLCSLTRLNKCNSLAYVVLIRLG